MRWGSSNPKKVGWYLVTLFNPDHNDFTVMPMYRQEYPPKNFTWQGNFSLGVSVIASIKFPNPYFGYCIK